MFIMNIEFVLKFVVLMYFGLVVVGVLMLFVIGFWWEVDCMLLFGCMLFCVYYSFIGLCFVLFGIGLWFFVGELMSGIIFVCVVCGFFVVFWIV